MAHSVQSGRTGNLTETSDDASRATSGSTSSVFNRFIAASVGRVANPLLTDVLDVDGVIRRIDFREVFGQVDWNDAFSQCDWRDAFSQCDWNDAFQQADFNMILEKIELNEVIERIDINRVLERIDINAVLERSDLKTIIARSTSGICSMAGDSIRAFCIKTDQRLSRMGRCSDCFWWRSDYKKWLLPPLPTVTPIGRTKERRQDRRLRASREKSCPRKASHLAIAVQGRNAGVCTRFIAFAIDKGIAIGFAFLFTVVFMLIYNAIEDNNNNQDPTVVVSDTQQYVNSLILPKVLGLGDQSNLTIGELKTLLTIYEAEQQKQLLAQIEQEANSNENNWWLLAGLPLCAAIVFGFVSDVFFLTVIGGRTIGKLVMGLVVLNSANGKIGRIPLWQAVWRSLLTNLFVGVISGVGAVISMGREDRRGVIDLMCSTTVVYAWDAKRFKLAESDFAPFGDLELAQGTSDGSMESGGSGGSAANKSHGSAEATPYLKRTSYFYRKKKRDTSNDLMYAVPAGSMTFHYEKSEKDVGDNNDNDDDVLDEDNPFGDAHQTLPPLVEEQANEVQ